MAVAAIAVPSSFLLCARLRDDARGLVEQFIKLTRLNLIVVLPVVVLILLVIPECLRLVYSYKWNADELDVCAEAARILCLVGALRAVSFVGPPLLDGIGRPELTLRYMVIAALAVPASFVLGAILLGSQLGLLSVAVAWVAGYPIAFAALSYLVTRSIALPVRDYLRAGWGIIACCLAGLAAGLVVSLALSHAHDATRLWLVGGASLAVTVTLFVTWQKITPRSIIAAIRG
jgi:O-antigen/teichoic acid export membrane protein